MKSSILLLSIIQLGGFFGWEGAPPLLNICMDERFVILETGSVCPFPPYIYQYDATEEIHGMRRTI